MSVPQEDHLAQLTERVCMLEDGMKMQRSRSDAHGKELKVILAEIHIVTEWIHQRFGKIGNFIYFYKKKFWLASFAFYACF